MSAEMPQTISDEATHLGKDYFPEATVLSAVDRCLEQFPPSDKAFFIQIKQEQNLPQLEVGYISQSFLVDFSFQAESQTIALLPIVGLETLRFIKEAGSSTFELDSSSARFSYTASIEDKRAELETYWLTVSRLIYRR